MPIVSFVTSAPILEHAYVYKLNLLNLNCAFLKLTIIKLN